MSVWKQNEMFNILAILDNPFDCSLCKGYLLKT